MTTRESLVATFGALVVAAVTVGSLTGQAQSNSAKQNGYDIAPVPLNTKGLNPAQVGKGSELVNAHGGCNDCHTAPPYAAGGDPFLGQPEQINTDGYLAGGVMFGPFIRSRNLTPRANGRPAGLTLDQFLEVMHDGTDFKDGDPMTRRILQVMPWPVYGKMSDKDLEAIYEYLRAIPCVGDAMRCGN